MDRYIVDAVTAYGRRTFRVVDLHESGMNPYVVARCDSPTDARLLAALCNGAALPGENLSALRERIGGN